MVFKTNEDVKNLTIMQLARLTEYKHEIPTRHIERIMEFVKKLAEEMSQLGKYKDVITKDYIKDIYISSMLHDIGMVGVPDIILRKKGFLTSDELKMIRDHCILGGDTLSSIEKQMEGPTFLTIAKEIAYCHHEKWDGSGYPKGLKGEEIPLSARIMALADVYDAMTSKRPYKNACTHIEASEIIYKGSGNYFDPEVVEAFMKWGNDFMRIREDFSDIDA